MKSDTTRGLKPDFRPVGEELPKSTHAPGYVYGSREAFEREAEEPRTELVAFDDENFHERAGSEGEMSCRRAAVAWRDSGILAARSPAQGIIRATQISGISCLLRILLLAYPLPQA